MGFTNRMYHYLVIALSLALAPAAMAEGTSAVRTSRSDAEIVHRLLAMNAAQQRASATVKGRISWPSVSQLADRISADHAALEGKLVELSDARPAPQVDGTADVALSRLSGEELEKAYIDRAVESHEAMLLALYRELPKAGSRELQRGLLEARTEIAAHLQAARDIQRQQWVLDTIKQQRADIAREIGQ